MRVLRLLGIGSVLGALALGLGGCGGDADADRAKVDEAERDVQAAIDGVLHDVADRAGLEFQAGSRSVVWCGESYAPRGVVIRNHLRFDEPAELPGDDARAVAVEALEEGGWTVARPGNPAIVEATKGVVVLRLDFRGIVQVDADTECIETAGDVAREFHGRDAEVEWR